MGKSTQNARLIFGVVFLIVGIILIMNSTRWGIDVSYASQDRYIGNGYDFSEVKPHLIPSNILNFKLVGAILMALGGLGVLTYRSKD